MKHVLFLLLALTACISDFDMRVDDSGPSQEGSSPLDAQTSETTDGDGGLDAHETGADSSTVDAATCVLTGDYCKWDIDAQSYNTFCCTKKCALNQQQQWRCIQ